MEVYDQLMTLKHSAADLEDENHNLKQQLRFRSDDFEFENPFWFEKTHPRRLPYPKCWSNHMLAPVGGAFTDSGGTSRACLTCGKNILMTPGGSRRSQIQPDYSR